MAHIDERRCARAAAISQRSAVRSVYVGDFTGLIATHEYIQWIHSEKHGAARIDCGHSAGSLREKVCSARDCCSPGGAYGRSDPDQPTSRSAPTCHRGQSNCDIALLLFISEET